MWRRLAGLTGADRGHVAGGRGLERRLRRISSLERRSEARAFLDTYHDTTGASREVRQRRWAEARRGLSRYGFYEHTPEELAYGARLAWRNSGRCIGRLLWESLEVIDARSTTDPPDMAARLMDHLRWAQGDGRVRSLMTVFAPVRGAHLPAYVESPHIVQYAGYPQADGSTMGDRRQREATRISQSLGWREPATPGRFDILPLLIRDDRDRRVLFDLPDGAVREVSIRHPHLPRVAELGLRWYAVPVISDMILTIGGIDYPCAPFNGFYMSTEIASRNLIDRDRYDLLSDVAAACGLRTESQASSLWRDTALTELNRAVLHSFAEDGITMLDHHAASAQFMTFHAREQAAGRRVAADWRWIVPPQASAATDVFHLRMRDFHPVPALYRSRADDGRALMPWRGDRYRSRAEANLDRIRRRWTLWKRMPW